MDEMKIILVVCTVHHLSVQVYLQLKHNLNTCTWKSKIIQTLHYLEHKNFTCLVLRTEPYVNISTDTK